MRAGQRRCAHYDRIEILMAAFSVVGDPFRAHVEPVFFWGGSVV
jgi:hypothetical protein